MGHVQGDQYELLGYGCDVLRKQRRSGMPEGKRMQPQYDDMRDLHYNWWNYV